MKRVIALFLSLSFIFALVLAMTLSVSAADPTHQNPLCFTANVANSTVKLKTNGAPHSGYLWYKTNNNAWVSYNIGDTITLTNIGDKVYFAGDGIYSTGQYKRYQFAMTGSISASGSINSLIDSSTDVETLPNDYCFALLFSQCKALTDASNLSLPAKTLTNNCYNSMFYSCSSLTDAPASLPATTLATACNAHMFEACTSLTKAPALLATSLTDSCYSGMFAGCKSLTNPPELKATKLATNCYQSMFSNCASLVMTETNINDPNAIWVFPTPTNASGWSNSYTCPNITVEAGKAYACTSWVNYSNSNGNATEEDDGLFESDPETDIVIGDTAYTFKYGNETVVIDENYYRDITESNNIFFEVDFSKANAKIDTTIIPNKVIKLINDAGKGIMFKDKYAYAVIDRPVMDDNNSTVIKLAEGIASYAQVKAMNTTHVEAEVEVAYKSNGESLDGNVKVYVPCDLKEARVFYIIDEHNIGEWPCEVIDGYCVFDRYKDGTYVVVK